MDEKAFLTQIDAALADGNMERAGEVAEAALNAGRRSVYLLNIGAWQREERGDFAGARALLEEALNLDPNEPLLHIGLGAVLRKEGQLEAGLAKFTSIIGIAGDNPAYWLERAYAFDFSALLSEAQKDYERSLVLDPNSAPAWAGVASTAVRLGDRTKARAAGGRALSLDSANATAHIALARCDLDEVEAGLARDRLIALTERGNLHPADQIIALGVLGDAHHRLEAHDAAFAAYASAKSVFRQLHAPAFVGKMGQADFIQSISDQLRETDLFTGAETGQGPEKAHIFLLGYPRSGTTLVETILASASNVEVLEERPTLRDADVEFLDKEITLQKLEDISSEDIEIYRALYWQRVREFGIDPTDKIFVDMDPLKGMKLPIIAKLFPEARIILMRRDPRDVVWSCFHTNFALSAAAYAFTSLDATARHYDALMRLTDQCLARFSLRVHEVRYDALISDFDAITRDLCDFVGLTWSEDLRGFDSTARTRTIQTASAGQVRKGLYDGGGQWVPYAAQMEPVLPILQPWIDRFGAP